MSNREDVEISILKNGMKRSEQNIILQRHILILGMVPLRRHAITGLRNAKRWAHSGGFVHMTDHLVHRICLERTAPCLVERLCRTNTSAIQPSL